MSYEDLREFGKIWILMGVFSTCFFASCGQSPTNSQESVTPVSHTQPVSREVEPTPVSMEREFEQNHAVSEYSEDLEGSGFSDPDYEDREQFGHDGEGGYREEMPPVPESVENSDPPTQEVSSNTLPTDQPEVAHRATSSPGEQPQTDGPVVPENESADSSETSDDSPLFAAQVDDDSAADDFSYDGDEVSTDADADDETDKG